MKKAMLFCVLVLLCGCVTITGADRLLNDQNKKIGVFIKAYSHDEVIQQAGDDVYKNSSQLEKAIGTPEEDIPYSSENSAKLIEQAQQEHKSANAIWDTVKNAAERKIPYAGTIIAFVTAATAFLKKRVSDQKNLALYAGVQNVIEGIKNIVEDVKLGKIPIDEAQETIKDLMAAKAIAFNMYPEIKKDLAKLKAEGIIKEG